MLEAWFLSLHHNTRLGLASRLIGTTFYKEPKWNLSNGGPSGKKGTMERGIDLPLVTSTREVSLLYAIEGKGGGHRCDDNYDMGVNR